MLPSGSPLYGKISYSRILSRGALPVLISVSLMERSESGFAGIIDGDYDDIPEGYFLNKGTIDEVVESCRE